LSATILRIYQTLAVEFQCARANQVYTNRKYVTSTPLYLIQTMKITETPDRDESCCGFASDRHTRNTNRVVRRRGRTSFVQNYLRDSELFVFLLIILVYRQNNEREDPEKRPRPLRTIYKSRASKTSTPRRLHLLGIPPISLIPIFPLNLAIDRPSSLLDIFLRFVPKELIDYVDYQ
jgi:hypothetical protein